MNIFGKIISRLLMLPMTSFPESTHIKCYPHAAYLPWTISHIRQPSSIKYFHYSSLIYPSPYLSFYHYINAFGFRSLGKLHVSFTFNVLFLSIVELIISFALLILQIRKPYSYRFAKVLLSAFFRFEYLSLRLASLRSKLSTLHSANPNIVYYDESISPQYLHQLRSAYSLSEFVELKEVERCSAVISNFCINSQPHLHSPIPTDNQRICLLLSKFQSNGPHVGFGQITLDCLEAALMIPCKTLIISIHPRQHSVPKEVMNLIAMSRNSNVQLVVAPDYSTIKASVYLFDISTACITVPSQLKYSQPSFLFYPNTLHLSNPTMILRSHVDIERLLTIRYDYTSPRFDSKFLPYVLNAHPM